MHKEGHERPQTSGIEANEAPGAPQSENFDNPEKTKTSSCKHFTFYRVESLTSKKNENPDRKTPVLIGRAINLLSLAEDFW